MMAVEIKEVDLAVEMIEVIDLKLPLVTQEADVVVIQVPTLYTLAAMAIKAVQAQVDLFQVEFLVAALQFKIQSLAYSMAYCQVSQMPFQSTFESLESYPKCSDLQHAFLYPM